MRDDRLTFDNEIGVRYNDGHGEYKYSVLTFQKVVIVPSGVTVFDTVTKRWDGELALYRHNTLDRRVRGTFEFKKSRTYPGCMRCVFNVASTEAGVSVIKDDGKKYVLDELTFVIDAGETYRVAEFHLANLGKWALGVGGGVRLKTAELGRRPYHAREERFGWGRRPIDKFHKGTYCFAVDGETPQDEYEDRGTCIKDAAAYCQNTGKPVTVFYVSATVRVRTEPDVVIDK